MIKHNIIHPSFVREDKRGIFIEVFNKGHWEQISYGSMKKDAVMGNHYHKLTDVFFFIIKGSVKTDSLHRTTNQTSTVTLSRNQGIFIKRNYAHAIRFLENSIFIMCKSIRYNISNSDTYPLIVPDL